VRCQPPRLGNKRVRAYAPGIYPRSAALVQATRDLDRGRAMPEEVDSRFDADLEELVAAQQEAGLDLLADGMLRWQDLFRPLVEAADGVEAGPLTRFLDTNTFFRPPRAISPEPELERPLNGRYIAPLPGAQVVTLPSPFALARGTGLPPTAFARGVLKPQIEALDVDLVVLSEPFLAQEHEPDLDAVSSALELLGGGPPLVLQLPFGDARIALERGLADLPVEGIGIDFYATHATDIPVGMGKRLLAGVVDARSSALEDPAALAAFAARLDERGIAEIDLVPNGDLQFVATPIAREKLRRLGAAR
jgi:5-methyltetrahydropteroyltriglutamate--homocysteine methyltransferase